MKSDISLKELYRFRARDLLPLTGDAGAKVFSARPREFPATTKSADLVIRLWRGRETYLRHIEFQAEHREVARLKPTNAGWTDAVDTVSYEKMMWSKFRDRRVLGDYATWAGDEVGVAVAADTEQIAEQALRLVEVEWEPLPFVLDPMAAMQPGAPVLHPEIADHNVLPPDPVGGPDVFLSKGDVERGFAAADVVLEMDTSHHNPTQGALDPWCCMAQWEGTG